MRPKAPSTQDGPQRWAQGALLLALGIVSALLLRPRGDDGLIGLPDLRAGDVAPRTVTSPRTFAAFDPIATSQSQERARKSVPLVLDHLVSTAQEVCDQVMSSPWGDNSTSEQSEELIAWITQLYERPTLSDADFLRLEPEMIVRSIGLDGQLLGEQLETIHPRGAHCTKPCLNAQSMRQVLERTRRWLDDAMALEAAERSSLFRHLETHLVPNFQLNRSESLLRKKQAEERVKPSMIVVESGDRILRAGERMTQRQAILLQELNRLESPNARIRATTGSALIAMILAWLGYGCARFTYRKRSPRGSELIFLASSMAGFLLFGFVGFKLAAWLSELALIPGFDNRLYQYCLPISMLAILVRAAAGPSIATISAPVFGLLAGFTMDADLGFAAVATAGCLAAATASSDGHRVVLSAGWRVMVAQAVMSLASKMLETDLDAPTVAWFLAASALSATSAGVLARVLLPAVEAIFGLSTPGGVAVFANADHPLLRELLVEAPGNYHHAQQVGHLAEAGAKSIGSDRLLARVGGFLHDIGRLGGTASAPQRRAKAVELASNQRFPSQLSSLISEQPLEEGSSSTATARPRSKSAALVFLADWVEDDLSGLDGTFADRRALQTRVRQVVRGVLARGLLDDSALELRELHTVEVAFAAHLADRFIGPASSGPRSDPQLTLN